MIKNTSSSARTAEATRGILYGASPFCLPTRNKISVTCQFLESTTGGEERSELTCGESDIDHLLPSNHLHPLNLTLSECIVIDSGTSGERPRRTVRLTLLYRLCELIHRIEHDIRISPHAPSHSWATVGRPLRPPLIQSTPTTVSHSLRRWRERRTERASFGSYQLLGNLFEKR